MYSVIFSRKSSAEKIPANLGTAAQSLGIFPVTEMDRRRVASPVSARQWSGGSSSTGSSSPAHPHALLGSNSTIKRAQNVAAKKAAQRLAEAMANTRPSVEGDDEDADEEDDLNFRFRAPPPPSHSTYPSAVNSNNSNSFHTISGPRINRSPSPAVISSILGSSHLIR